MKPLLMTALAAACTSLAAPAAGQFSLASEVDGWTPRGGSGAPAGWLASSYAYDDGTSENGLGLSNGGTLVFLQGYKAVAGADVVSAINVAWGTPTKLGSSPAAGTSVTVYLWDDPTDDGDPSDGVLLRTSVSTLANPETDTKQRFLFAPALVKGHFFIGAKVQHAKGQFPAPVDHSQNSGGRTWVTGNASGGYTGTPVAGPVGLFELGTLPFQGVWLLDAEGVGYASLSYCTPKTNSLGCDPEIGSTGVPNASTATSGFTVLCDMVRNNKSGLLFYKANGSRANVPFQCGTLCVGPSGIKRTPAQSAGGNPAGNDCSGMFSLDMNAFANGLAGGNPDPALLVPGAVVHCQWWGRDQGFAPPCNTTLSDGLEYYVQ